jgi:hypothetical protein
VLFLLQVRDVAVQARQLEGEAQHVLLAPLAGAVAAARELHQLAGELDVLAVQADLAVGPVVVGERPPHLGP